MRALKRVLRSLATIMAGATFASALTKSGNGHIYVAIALLCIVLYMTINE